ncbi:MAG TPA: sulfite exporter TauE/SafE family protein [Holophagaceae bacterium]|nr:sulfite exporter TauE/SafE family protein [Holophagaceae bacterium]
MPPLHLPQWLALAGITLAAAVLNGALGHGFSTLTVPVALLWLSQRLLNPVLVLLELVINLWAFLTSLGDFPAVAARVRPIALALLPGILVGGLVLRFVPAGPLKIATYALLLPLALWQAFGRKPARTPHALAYGGATGLLYGLTTISGPVLSLYFHHHHTPKHQYRAAISFLRLVESSVSALTLLSLGLLGGETVRAALPLLPGVIVGLLLGQLLLRWIPEGGFRRFCALFNVFALSFGLARLLQGVGLNPLAGLALWVIPTAFVLQRTLRTEPQPAQEAA